MKTKKQVETIEVFNIDTFKGSITKTGWKIERIEGNIYHSGGYRLISPDERYTIEHTVRLSSGYQVRYNCTINNSRLWQNADLNKGLRSFMLELGNLEFNYRNTTFDNKRSNLLKKFTFDGLNDK